MVPNDPLYSSQWHYFDRTPGRPPSGGANLPNAWNRTTGWSGIRTAVLDTGALKTHPDLAGRFVGGYDFIKDWVVANDNDPVPPVTCPASNPLSAGCDNRDADASDPGDWVTAAESAGSGARRLAHGMPGRRQLVARHARRRHHRRRHEQRDRRRRHQLGEPDRAAARARQMRRLRHRHRRRDGVGVGRLGERRADQRLPRARGEPVARRRRRLRAARAERDQHGAREQHGVDHRRRQREQQRVRLLAGQLQRRDHRRRDRARLASARRTATTARWSRSPAPAAATARTCSRRSTAARPRRPPA